MSRYPDNDFGRIGGIPASANPVMISTPVTLANIDKAKTVEELLALLAAVAEALENGKMKPLDAMRCNAAAQRTLKALHGQTPEHSRE